ncbi:threonine--tRNA ligase [Nitrospira sp. Kam-Ns4a]
MPAGCTAAQALDGPGGGVGPEVFAVKVNGVVRDLETTLAEDAILEPVTFDSPDGREVYRHSSTHIMAQAVKEVFPSAQLAIGPAIEEGFYYDFAFERPFTPEDLQKIEARIQEIIKADRPFRRMEMPREEAIRFFRDRGELYKVDILESIDDPTVSLYSQGEFVDLCRGPHVPSTGRIRAIKLLSSAGAYWRGDERNPMLQRIYGTSFPTQAALDAHLAKLEEIKRRDHRKLGKELDLITIQDEIGPGLVLWHPKGALVRLLIENFWREQHLKQSYQLVYSPHIARLDLWRISGHVDYYRDNMFAPMKVEASEYQLKPMNCPFHIMIYKSHLRSYRDLPIRYGELGTVYRYERTGVLHGLLRVRGFTQDDAHLFCRPDQLEAEVSQVLDFTFFVLRTFGFTEFEVYLSTRPEKAVGSPEHWAEATGALEAALKSRGIAYAIDPGEGVFYGPKIDIKIKDVLGRAWQCSTVQVDFNNPERFGLAYTGEDGKPHQPIMIHRALMGSIERFFGILIEHYAGAFPVWLAPVQVRVLTITDRQRAYAQSVADRLKGAGLRVESDFRNEKVGLKVREAEVAKVPYMAVIGDREVQDGTVSVRARNNANLGTKTVAEVIELIRAEAAGPGEVR